MFFRFTTSGESHGRGLTVIIEGLPAGLPIDLEAINFELWRRQQGYGRGGRMKIESDKAEIYSGIRHGRTLGSPVTLFIENRDFVHWQDIMSPIDQPDEVKQKRKLTRPRPGHADLAGGQKFGASDLRDILERASARETAARVAAGALAKQFLAQFDIVIKSHVAKIGSVPEEPIEAAWEEISSINPDSRLSCVNPAIEARMINLIDEAKERGDTLGGVFEVVCRGLIPGLGSHTSWQEKLDGRLAQAIMSIHAVKAVEIGQAIRNAARFGSEAHDEIVYDEAKPFGYSRKTNRAGGLEGGITNGEELRIRGYMKPISTLRKPLESVDILSHETSPAAFERSDITAVPAAAVIGEAMTAIILADAFRQKFGGDSLNEILSYYGIYREKLKSY